jgi:hypothetical protein
MGLPPHPASLRSATLSRKREREERRSDPSTVVREAQRIGSLSRLRERVGVRALIRSGRLAVSPPHPASLRSATLSRKREREAS